MVTPLAKEHLKRAGIDIRWISGVEADRNWSAGEWGFAIEVEAHSGLLEAFRRSLLEGPDAWRELGGTLDAAVGWVMQTEARGGLLLANEASVAVYRACRSEGVRASSAEDSGAVARAVRALGANLIVIEPAGKSIAMLKQMGTTFRRAGRPIVPAWIPTGSLQGVST